MAFDWGQDFATTAQLGAVIDDVCTTGATARSAVQTLRQGIQVYGLVALATGQRPKPKLS